MEEQLVTVETYSFLAQAEAAKLQLEGSGITVFLADAETVNMDWLLGNAIGNIKLQVPAEQAERALEVLDDMKEKARERREAESEDDEGERCLACGTKIPEDESRCPSCGWSYAQEEHGANGSLAESQKPSEDANIPASLSILRVMKRPVFWFFLTPTIIIIFWLVSALVNWLANIR